MKKSLSIIVLVAMLSACAGQADNYAPANSLISYAEISRQITVRHELLEDVSVAEQSTTPGFGNTPGYSAAN